MNCYFCNKSFRDVEKAISEGWTVSFWDEDDECEKCEAVCLRCARKWLVYDEEICGHTMPSRCPSCKGGI